MHILGAYMHIHTKYEVSILNPVTRRAVQTLTTPTMLTPMTPKTMHDGQIMIITGSFGRIPNEPKKSHTSSFSFLFVLMYTVVFVFVEENNTCKKNISNNC